MTGVSTGLMTLGAWMEAACGGGSASWVAVPAMPENRGDGKRRTAAHCKQAQSRECGRVAGGSRMGLHAATYQDCPSREVWVATVAGGQHYNGLSGSGVYASRVFWADGDSYRHHSRCLNATAMLCMSAVLQSTCVNLRWCSKPFT